MAEEKQVSIRVYLSEDLRNLLKAKSALRGQAVNDAVVGLIEDFVSDLKQNQAKSKK